MHFVAGIGDKCSNQGVKKFTELLSNWSGSQGYCVYGIIFVFIVVMMERVILCFLIYQT
jgi:hypothetical protein